MPMRGKEAITFHLMPPIGCKNNPKSQQDHKVNALNPKNKSLHSLKYLRVITGGFLYN